jgi:chromosome segregation protein
MYLLQQEEALHNSNGAVILEKSGKYVKGAYNLSGGSVGLFEGKKIGRAKNLEKLRDEIESSKQPWTI